MKKTTISKIMHKDVMSVRSTTSAQQCAVKMTKERVGCLIVLEKREPVGIITERGFADLVKKGNFDCKKVTAQDFMTKPIISIDANASYEKAMRVFDKEEIKRMPVTDDGDVVGLLTLRNLVIHSKRSMNKLKRENSLLKRMSEQRGMTRE
jgi:signal-transduction protein with cAMP-binding, CBS, and nucleotidyltransferase domain|tara:strand:+ start:226 stop:678 length:453 start_codon:yes stop_codon:yes gene_type:complete